jgi:hypothetical protein
MMRVEIAVNRPSVSGELWGEKPAGAHHCQSATGCAAAGPIR